MFFMFLMARVANPAQLQKLMMLRQRQPARYPAALRGAERPGTRARGRR
jgi:hypothetical protein